MRKPPKGLEERRASDGKFGPGRTATDDATANARADALDDAPDYSHLGERINPRELTRPGAGTGRGNWGFAAPGEIVYLHVGVFPSNTYIGASQAYGNIYVPYELTEDDTVLQSAAGRSVSVAGDGQRYKARFNPNEQHLFERGPNVDLAPEVGYERPSINWDNVGDRFEPEKFDAAYAYSGEKFGAMDYLLDS